MRFVIIILGEREKIKILVIINNLKEDRLISLNLITNTKHRKGTSFLHVFQHTSSALFLNQLVDWIVRVHVHPQGQVNSTSPLKSPPRRHMNS